MINFVKLIMGQTVCLKRLDLYKMLRDTVSDKIKLNSNGYDMVLNEKVKNLGNIMDVIYLSRVI